MRRALRIILGIVLIILGVFALLTPLSPGSWLALIGLEILGLRILFQRKLLSLTPRKYRGRVRNMFKSKLLFGGKKKYPDLGKSTKGGWGRVVKGGGDKDHITITNKKSERGPGAHITTETGKGSSNIRDYFDDKGNYLGSE